MVWVGRDLSRSPKSGLLQLLQGVEQRGEVWTFSFTSEQEGSSWTQGSSLPQQRKGFGRYLTVRYMYYTTNIHWYGFITIPKETVLPQGISVFTHHQTLLLQYHRKKCLACSWGLICTWYLRDFAYISRGLSVSSFLSLHQTHYKEHKPKWAAHARVVIFQNLLRNCF